MKQRLGLLIFGIALGIALALAVYTIFGTLVTLCYLAACIASLQWQVSDRR